MDDHQQVEDYFVSRMGKTNLKQTEVPNRNCSVEQVEISTFTKRGPIWKVWANMSYPPQTKNMEELLVDLGTLQTSGSVELAKRDGHMTAVFLWWIRWGFLFFDDFYKISKHVQKWSILSRVACRENKDQSGLRYTYI